MKQKFNHQALARRVLAVAVINYRPDGTLFDWTAYVDSVAGENHDNEYMAVARSGAKLSKEIALLMFSLPKEKWRR